MFSSILSTGTATIPGFDLRQLGDGIELVKGDIFWPNGHWSIRKCEMVWSKIEGWKRYYEIDRTTSIFRTADEAMQACNGSGMHSAL